MENRKYDDTEGGAVKSSGSPVSNNENGIANTTSSPVKQAVEQEPIMSGQYRLSSSDMLGGVNSSYADPTGGDRRFLTGFENTRVQDFNEIQAQSQNSAEKLGKGALRVVSKAATEVIKLPGYVGGAAYAIGSEDGSLDDVINNAWVRNVEDLNQSINDDLLKVYATRASQEGSITDAIFSSGFWASEGADGLGFILSMLVPGAAVKGLGVGSKLIQGVNAGSKLVSNADKALKVTTAMNKMGITASNIDLGLMTAVNTLAEAGAEAGGAVRAFEGEFLNFMDKHAGEELKALSEFRQESGMTDEDYESEYNSIYSKYKQKFDEQKGNLGADIFQANTSILVVPNLLQNMLLFGGGGKILSKFTTSKPSTWKSFAKGSGVSVFSEGFFEEGLQSTVEGLYSDKAFKGDLKGNIYSDTGLNELGDEYWNMLNTLDGQKAVFLGAFFGGIMGGVGGMRTAKDNYVRSLRAAVGVSSSMGITNALNNIYIKEDGKIVTDENGKPTINPSALGELGKALGENTALSEVYKALTTGTMSPDSTTSNEEAIEILRDFAALQLAESLAIDSEMGEDMKDDYFKEIRNSINNDPNLSEIEKKLQLENVNKVEQKVNDVLPDLVTAREVYNDLGMTSKIDTSKLNVSNKDQEISRYNTNLTNAFVSSRGKLKILKGMKESLEVRRGQLIGMGTPEDSNVIKNIDDKIEELDKESNELTSEVSTKFFNKKFLQEDFDKFANSTTAAHKTTNIKALEDLTKRINKAMTVEELETITNNNKDIDDAFQKEVDRRKRELTKKASEEESKIIEKNQKSDDSELGSFNGLTPLEEDEIFETDAFFSNRDEEPIEFSLEQLDILYKKFKEGIENGTIHDGLTFQMYLEGIEMTGEYLSEYADNLIEEYNKAKAVKATEVTQNPSSSTKEAEDTELTKEESENKDKEDVVLVSTAIVPHTNSNAYRMPSPYNIINYFGELYIVKAVVKEAIYVVSLGTNKQLVLPNQPYITTYQDSQAFDNYVAIQDDGLYFIDTNNGEYIRSGSSRYEEVLKGFFRAVMDDKIIETIEYEEIEDVVEIDTTITPQLTDGVNKPSDNIKEEVTETGLVVYGQDTNDNNTDEQAESQSTKKSTPPDSPGDGGITGIDETYVSPVILLGPGPGQESKSLNDVDVDSQIPDSSETKPGTIDTAETPNDMGADSKPIDEIEDIKSNKELKEISNPDFEEPDETYVPETIAFKKKNEDDDDNTVEGKTKKDGIVKRARVVMMRAQTRLYNWVTKPKDKKGTKLGVSVLNRTSNNPNYKGVVAALDIYHRLVLPVLQSGRTFDIQTSLKRETIQDKKNRAVNKLIKEIGNSNSKEYFKAYKAKISKFDEMLEELKQDENISINRDMLETLIKYLPLRMDIDISNEDVNQNIYGNLDHMKDEDNPDNERFNNNNPRHALPIRIQLIDALLTGRLNSVDVVIEDQFPGMIVNNYDENGKNVYSNVLDLKFIRELESDEDRIAYLANNIYYSNGIDTVNGLGVTATGLTPGLGKNQGSNSGSVYLRIPRANGSYGWLKLTQGNFGISRDFSNGDTVTEEMHSLIALLAVSTVNNLPLSAVTMTSFMEMVKKDITLQDGSTLFDGIQDYIDEAMRVFGPEAKVSDVLSLLVHNSSNELSALNVINGSISVGSIMFRFANNRIKQLLGPDPMIDPQDLINSMMNRNPEDPSYDPSDDLFFSFAQYLNALRKNIKIKGFDDLNLFADPEYVYFLIKHGHVKTNAVTESEVFGNPDVMTESGKVFESSSSNLHIGNSLLNKDGSPYVLSFDPMVANFNLPEDAFNGVTYKDLLQINKERKAAIRERTQKAAAAKKLAEIKKKPVEKVKATPKDEVEDKPAEVGGSKYSASNGISGDPKKDLDNTPMGDASKTNNDSAKEIVKDKEDYFEKAREELQNTPFDNLLEFLNDELNSSGVINPKTGSIMSVYDDFDGTPLENEGSIENPKDRTITNELINLYLSSKTEVEIKDKLDEICNL